MSNRAVVTVDQWTATNGNPCFHFAERDLLERPWIIIVAFLVLAIISGLEYFIYGTVYLLTPCVLLFFFLVLWWLTIPLKANERVVEKTAHDIMDEMVADDALAAGAKVVNSFVHCDTKGTYGVVTYMCFLVLLDNGEVWEYPIFRHNEEEGDAAYFECSREHLVSDNLKHIRAINPKRLGHISLWSKLSTVAKIRLAIVVILLVGGLSFAGVFWLIFRFKWWVLLFVGAYLVLYSFTEWVYGKSPGRILGIVRNIVSVPFVVFTALVGIVHAFVTVAFPYFFLAAFAFAFPAAVLVLVSNALGWGLRLETIVFIVMSVGSILCTNSYALTKWIIHQTPLRDWGNHRYESNREALAVYLIHPSIIVFLLYLLYFLYLAVSGYLQIQNGGNLISAEFDAAILKAFLVFIAFTNMRSKASVAEMDATKVLKGIGGLFVHDR